MMNRKCNVSLTSVLQALGVAAFWLVLWAFFAHRVGKELLLPSPYAVLRRLGLLVTEPSFWQTLLTSLWHVLGGILLAGLCGILGGVLSHVSGFWRALTRPLQTVVKATPVASFILLALVWLDRGILPGFISFLIVLPVIWTGIATGLGTVGRDEREMVHMFRLSPPAVVKALYIPHLLPYLAAAFRSALGLAWKAGIAAEVLALSPHSIGQKLYEAKTYLETTDLFAWTAVIILLSLLFEIVFEAALARLTPAPERRPAHDMRP